MSRSIITLYLKPTAGAGPRIRARVVLPAGRKFLTHPYDHALSEEANHRVAAQALRNKLQMEGALVSAEFDYGAQGFVHIVVRPEDWPL